MSSTDHPMRQVRSLLKCRIILNHHFLHHLLPVGVTGQLHLPENLVVTPALGDSFYNVSEFSEEACCNVVMAAAISAKVMFELLRVHCRFSIRDEAKMCLVDWLDSDEFVVTSEHLANILNIPDAAGDMSMIIDDPFSEKCHKWSRCGWDDAFWESPQFVETYKTITDNAARFIKKIRANSAITIPPEDYRLVNQMVAVKRRAILLY